MTTRKQTKQETKSLAALHEVIDVVFNLNKRIEGMPFEFEFEYGYGVLGVKITPFSDEIGDIPLGLLLLDSPTIAQDKTELVKNLNFFVDNIVLREPEGEDDSLAHRLTAILLEVKQARFVADMEDYWEMFSEEQDMQQEEILSKVPAINKTAH
jgi:hypothetical protein